MAGLIVAFVALLMAGCSYARPACDEHPFFINAGSEGDCAVQRREDDEREKAERAKDAALYAQHE